MPRRITPLDPARRERFLTSLRTHGVFVQAARDASPGTEGAASTFRAAIARDAAFAEQVRDALEEAASSIEMEVRRRAFDGAVESRSNGGSTWYSTRLSDACLLALAKARVPAFRDKVQVDATVGGTVKHEHSHQIDVKALSDAELEAMVAILDRLEARGPAAPAALPEPMDADFEIQGDEL